MIQQVHTNGHTHTQRNALGAALQPCSTNPVTGFYRTGCCETGPDDEGMHTVCIVATEEFLEFSRKVGNDLSTPRPDWGFEGIEPGDRWCLCAVRWLEALQHGHAPEVVLEATNEATLGVIPLEELRKHAVT